MKRRLAASILALLMLFSLAACSNDPVGHSSGDDTTVPADTTAADETTLPEETQITPDLPDVGDMYKGTTFTVVHRGPDQLHYAEPWVYAESINGDTINDAVYKRNAYIEEKYGVDITEQVEDNPMEAVEIASNSQDDIYDIAFPRVNTISSRMLKGMMYNVHDLTYADFDKPWWDSNCIDALTYQGKLYIAISDISLTNTTGTMAYLFNRELVREYGLEDPYDLVKNNQWTQEKMRELIQKVGDDVDGNNEYNDEDVYGILVSTGSSDMQSAVIGAGIPIFDVTADGEITVKVFNENTIDVLEFCRSFLSDKVHTRHINDLDYAGSPDKWYHGLKLFSEDHFLFHQNNARCFDDFTALNMESEYGIVPNPKWTADQAEYHHMLDDYNSALIVPSTNQPEDIERISILLEDMAYMSSQTVLPEYYETIIALRRARVPELGEMVDIIKNSIHYDISFLFDTGYTDALSTVYDSGNYASSFTRYERIVNANLKKIVKSLEALD